MVIVGWPFQGLSMTGNQHGFQDKRSACFPELIQVLDILQKIQANRTSYIIENAPVILESKGRNVKSAKYIHEC